MGSQSQDSSPRWTRQEATDWFWSRTHMDVWSHLAVDRGWPAERVIEHVIDSLWSDLIKTDQKRYRRRMSTTAMTGRAPAPPARKLKRLSR